MSAMTKSLTMTEREVFTEGDCWMLAWFLHKKTGLFITTDCCFDCWTHVAVTDGKRVLDIDGWSSLTDWMDKWAAEWEKDDFPSGTARDVDEYMELICWPWGWESQYGWEDADMEEVAQRLLTAGR